MLSKKHYITTSCRLIFFVLLFPSFLAAEIKTWTGYGGDAYWSNPLNWSNAVLPLVTDDVLLDNRNLPVSFQVILPDIAITIRTIQINPSPGRNIELILPASNKVIDGFTVTGPGYGIDLNAGAIFRNASGISSGESLLIADSIIIRDGGRYIHQTRASHAAGILKFLSTAPGTEQGIFDFDVPRASYTISVSNRIYGSLELHATALSAPVNYTCTGANPLLVRGNLRIGPNVSMSTDLSGVNGNIRVDGDFIQEGGQLNLAAGAGDNTILRVKGDLYQAPNAVITESTNSGNPWLELNGSRIQEIAMAGQVRNQVGFRMNNMSGAILRLPLRLPWKLDLSQGSVYSSAAAMIVLDTLCTVIADSSRLIGSCVEGPLLKLGLNQEDHFLFPLGKDGNLRWLELKQASGNYQAEYFHDDPASLGTTLAAGLNHISKLEYWTIMASGAANGQTQVELSFSSAQSGGVTDPNYLNVARFNSVLWVDAGHSAITGNFLQGSVLSDADFISGAYTLGSTVELANPLPLTDIELEVKEISGETIFSWTVKSPEAPDHFDLYEEKDGNSILLARISAVYSKSAYSWMSGFELKKGNHYFRVHMVDIHGHEYSGKIVLFKKVSIGIHLSQIVTGSGEGGIGLLINTDSPDIWKYEIISLGGSIVQKGILELPEGKTIFQCPSKMISKGIYVFRAAGLSGKSYSLLFVQN